MDESRDFATAETEHSPAPGSGRSVDALAATGISDPPGGSRSDTLLSSDPATTGPRPLPTQIGKYFVLGPLGQGGMGSVVTVYNPDLDRKSVIKLVRPDHVSDTSQRRLLREARLLASLSHANVVQVYDSGVHGDDVYIVMEFIAGSTLDAWRRKGPHPWPEVLAIHHQAGLGLAAAHAKGIVHRDFTPRNVMIGDDGRVCVLDFGLSHNRDTTGPAAIVDTAHSTDTGETSPQGPGGADATGHERFVSLTRTGAVVGTPRYMSPEQLVGAPTDARSDQFSFCVVLWEALFGQLPFSGLDLYHYNRAVLAGTISEPGDRRGVPPELLAAVRRGLSRKPDDRFADMPALLAALRPAPVTGNPARSGLVVGLLGVTIGLGLWAASGPSITPRERCTAIAAEALAAVWTEQSGAGLSLAAHVGVERFAGAWQTARRDLCAAHLSGALPAGPYARGLECLAPHRELLAGIGQAVAGGATHLDLGELPDPARVAACADPWNMSSGPELAGLRDRAEARRIGGALAEARAALIAGRYGDSEALAAAAVDEARALDHGPTLATALYHLARARSHGRRAAAAEAALLESAVLAARYDLHELAADDALRLLRVAALAGDRPQDGRVWFEVLRGRLARVGEVEGPRVAEAHEYLGEIARAEGDLPRARRQFEQALAGRRDAWPFLRTPALIGLGRLATASGDFAAARDYFTEALQIVSDELGRDHPKNGPPLLDLAEAHLAEDHPERAAPLVTRALALLPADSPLLPVAHYLAAQVAELQDDPARALALAEQARLALRAADLAPELRAYRPRVLDLVGRMTERTAGRRAALAPYRELLALPDVRDQIDPVGLAIALANAASFALDDGGDGDDDLALRFVAAARPVLTRLAPAFARDLDVDLALVEGPALIRGGRPAAAALAMQRALEAWDPRGEASEPRAAELHYTLFTALERDAPAQARAHALRARELLPPLDPRRGVIATWLRDHPTRTR